MRGEGGGGEGESGVEMHASASVCDRAHEYRARSVAFWSRRILSLVARDSRLIDTRRPLQLDPAQPLLIYLFLSFSFPCYYPHL